MHRITAIAALTAAPSLALAGGELGDVGLVIDNGQLITAIGDDDANTFEDFGFRVFGAELQDNWEGTGLVGIDDPGYLILDGTQANSSTNSNIANLSVVDKTVTTSLRAWTGADFSGSTTNTMEFDYLGGTTSTPGADSNVDIFSAVYNGGAFDEHPEYFLIGDGVAGSPESGVFLYEAFFTVTDSSGSLSTDTLFFVFAYNASDADFDAAFEYAEDVLVPAPGALAILAGTGLLAARRRRA